MKKTLMIIIGAGLFLSILLTLRFTLGGSEDSWICSNGEWIKHGNPSSPAPTTGCASEEKQAECSSYDPASCPEECVVCPPCAACSSISCQTKDFCENIGVDESWYKNILKNITTFEECVGAGNPVTENEPRECHVGEKIFIEKNSTINNTIKITTPQENDLIKTPLVIKGEAKGSWFFKGEFPVFLVTSNNIILGEGVAVAQGNWETDDFVKFTATINFEKIENNNAGKIVLQMNNASGLSENDDYLSVPVLFE